TSTSSSVIFVYSICWPPALQTDNSILLRCLPLAQCFMTAGAALSMRATTCRSLKLALPAPRPPPLAMLPGWVAPHENEMISLQFLWLASFDSPLAPSIFMNMSTATSLSKVAVTARRALEKCPSAIVLLQRGQLGHEAQRHRQPFELIVRPQEKLGRVITGVVLDLLDLDLGGGQRLAGLGFLRRIDRIAIGVIHDPVVEPALHGVALAERTDLVAHDALQVVREAAAREQVRQARRQLGIGRGVGIVVFVRLLQRLGADEGGEIRVLAMH